MGFGVDDDHYEPSSSTPRLSLSKLPYCRRPREPLLMQTPPLRPPVSIPFRWEEEPGRPRATAEGPPSARCLDLPPRLTPPHEAKTNTMPSPTTVLDGPNVGRSLSLACTFSFRKGAAAGAARRRSGGRNRGSARWADVGEFDGGSLDILHPLDGDCKRVKNPRVRKRKGFFSLSSITYKLWKKTWERQIYGRLKQTIAVPWNHWRPTN